MAVFFIAVIPMSQVLPVPQFRLKFDVPHSFAVEPGYVRATHCHDFREEKGSFAGTWRDPLTGVLMLRPSFVSNKITTSAYWKPLTQWTYDPLFWRQVYDGLDPAINDGVARFWASINPRSGGSYTPFSGNAVHAAVVSTTALVSLAGVIASDVLYWAHESTFEIAQDEGFVWYYRAISKGNMILKNWFAVQFADWLFHFSLQGEVKVYHYGVDMTIEPELYDAFEIASYSDIVGQDGYFVFLPIPGRGLALYHTHSPQNFGTQASSANSLAKRGQLVKIIRFDGSDKLTIHAGGKVRIAINGGLTLMGYKFAYHAIRYDTFGTSYFTGELFDPQFPLSNQPGNVEAIEIITSRTGSATVAIASLRNADDTLDWVAPTDRQGRVRLGLLTGDPVYTPFILGTYVAWSPVLVLRNTTPVIVPYDKLEFSESDNGQVEGRVDFSTGATPALTAIVARADTTWQIERCDNPNLPEESRVWTILCGGLAQMQGEAQAFLEDHGRSRIVATFTLWGMERRFDEITQIFDSAFDGNTIGIAINNVLIGGGFAPIIPLPAETLAVSLPGVPAGQHWRYAPRKGDSGAKILKALLMFLRSQWVEWRMRYVWQAGEWVAEKKPRDTSTLWTLTPFEDEVDLTQRKLLIGDGSSPFKFSVSTPEGNVVQAFGLTDPNNEGKRVPGTPLLNRGSLYDPSSPDYLGRLKTIYPLFAPINDVTEINRMSRRVYDAACHREVRLVALSGDYIKDMVLPAQAVVRWADEVGNRAYFAIGPDYTSEAEQRTGWIRQRTTVIDADCHISCLYSVSSQWEGPISE